tara:strand:+ start:1725 stop:2801 length:1077 start_codon:yes stop_codon:yes gene_type:complete
MSDQIDIIRLHNETIKLHQKNKTNIDLFKHELEKLKDLCENNISSHTTSNIQNQIKILKQFIHDLENDISYNYYIMESSPIIEEYKCHISKPITISFMSPKKSLSNNSHLIKKYINIYNKYNTKVSYKNNINKCIHCNNTSFDTIDNIVICTNCGNSINILIQNSSFKDSERINIVPKYTYNRKSHFRDCLNQYQGKQQVNIKEDVYKDLIKQFELNHLLVGNKNTPKKERFSKITKKHILLFLKETKNSKHYEDVNLIYYNLTGMKTNDISHLENMIMEDFEKLTNAYDILYKNNKSIDRKSFINSQYVLYQLLLKHKHPCNKQDFNILKTADRQTFHDDICSELFKYLGWNFKCIF